MLLELTSPTDGPQDMAMAGLISSKPLKLINKLRVRVFRWMDKSLWGKDADDVKAELFRPPGVSSDVYVLHFVDGLIIKFKRPKF